MAAGEMKEEDSTEERETPIGVFSDILLAGNDLKDSLRESQDPLLEAEAENAEETAADRCGCRTGFVLNFANKSSIDGAFVVLSEELSFSGEFLLGLLEDKEDR